MRLRRLADGRLRPSGSQHLGQALVAASILERASGGPTAASNLESLLESNTLRGRRT